MKTKTIKQMKTLLTVVAMVVGVTLSFGQMVKHGQTKSTAPIRKEQKVIPLDTANAGKDPDVYVYKCVDAKTNDIVYVDLLDIGYVGFFTNKTLVKYKVHMYTMSAKDTAWEYDYVSILMASNMPIELIQFDPDETKILLFMSNKDGQMDVAKLNIVKKLGGFSELLYIRKKKRYATFTYGDDRKIPTYIKYEKKK